MNSNELIKKIKNDFKSLEEISLSELNIAVASPSRKAIEHNFFYISTIENQNKRTFFGKNLLSECKDLINFEVIDSNYKKINSDHTPKLFCTFPELKLVIIDFLESYKTTNLKDLRKNENLIQIIKFKKDLAKNDRLDSSKTVFNAIDDYINYININKISKKFDLSFYINNYFFIKNKFENIDQDTCPCHVDNTASNFMINDKGSIKFIDLDYCSNVDPVSDLGAFASEVCLFKNEINKLIEEYYGFFRQDLSNRCFIYSILDDLRWGLFNYILNNISTRKNIEFMKYANWKFLSFKQKILSYDIGEILENI